MKIRDKYGYPVEVVRGQHFRNFLRYLFRGSLEQTFKKRK